jgi:hypothetical protein
MGMLNMVFHAMPQTGALEPRYRNVRERRQTCQSETETCRFRDEDLMLLDITSLRTFVAAADAGSFTRAAGVVNLTQSAVSVPVPVGVSYVSEIRNEPPSRLGAYRLGANFSKRDCTRSENDGSKILVHRARSLSTS